MKYKDDKWSIIYDDKKGLKIFVQCECGNKLDIQIVVDKINQLCREVSELIRVVNEGRER